MAEKKKVQTNESKQVEQPSESTDQLINVNDKLDPIVVEAPSTVEQVIDATIPDDKAPQMAATQETVTENVNAKAQRLEEPAVSNKQNESEQSNSYQEYTGSLTNDNSSPGTPVRTAINCDFPTFFTYTPTEHVERVVSNMHEQTNVAYEFYRKVDNREGNKFIAFKLNALRMLTKAQMCGQLSSTQLQTEGVVLYKECLAAQRSLTVQASENVTQSDGSDLSALGICLNDLCDANDALRSGGGNGFYLRGIASAAQAVQSDCVQLNEWCKSWEQSFRTGRLTPLCEQLDTFCNTARSIQEHANDGARNCDSAKFATYYRNICNGMKSLQISQHVIECEIERLECVPEYEPPFAMMTRQFWNQAGYCTAHMAHSLRAISIPCEDTVTEQQSSWIEMNRCAQAVQKEFRRAISMQPCLPSGYCKDSADKLEACTAEGVKVVRQHPDNQYEQRVLAELHSKSYALTQECLKQAQSIPGFNMNVFGGLGWAHAGIMQQSFINDPACAEDECTTTKQQLACLFELLDKLRETSNETDCVGSESCSHKPSTPPPSGGQKEDRIVIIRKHDDREYYRGPILEGKAERASIDMARVAATWQKMEEIANDSRRYLPEPLASKIGNVITTAQTAQRRIENYQSGQLPFTQVLPQILRKPASAYAMLQSTLSVALDHTSASNRQQLRSIHAQLPELQRQVQSLVN